MEYVVFFGVITLVACAGVRELLGRRAPRWIERAYELSTEGKRRDALRWTTRVLLVGPGPTRFSAHFLRMTIFSDRGDTSRAVALAHQLRRKLNPSQLASCPWQIVNTIVVVLINGGQYAAALAAIRIWTPEQQERGRTEDEQFFVIARINEAEALSNHARIDEALTALDEVREAAREWPFARAGLIVLRAWILLQVGRVREARATLEGADLSALDPLYAAEVEYTRAALERDSGQLERAMEHAERGLAAAQRASSRRNGLFMIAGIAAQDGDHERAHRLFEEGAHSRYRAQAGEGLSRYARFLESVGEAGKARRVRRWILSRDPEWRAPLTDV
jgi:tetratricopeptide (TPR) repeat protein